RIAVAYLATRGIYQIRAPLHLPDERVVEEVFGLRVQWSVDCNHVPNTDHRLDVRVVSEVQLLLDILRKPMPISVAKAFLRPRPDDLRSLALRDGACTQARRLAQWCPVQGLGFTGRDGTGAAQARRRCRRRSTDGRRPHGGAYRWAAGGRGGLCRGYQPRRPFRRCD